MTDQNFDARAAFIPSVNRQTSTMIVFVDNASFNTVVASTYQNRRVQLQADGNCWLFFNPAEQTTSFTTEGWYVQNSTGIYPLSFHSPQEFLLYSPATAGWAQTVRLLIEEWND